MISLMLVTWPFSISSVLAQDTEAEEPELASVLVTLQIGRRETIRAEIYFTKDEAAAFWPAYDAYVADMQPVRDRRVKMIRRYLQAYNDGSVSEDFAIDLVDEDLAIKTEMLKIRKKHLERIRKILPPFKAARFYQLENKLDAEINGQLARDLPLIDPV
jgi:hypothetical protein